MTESREKFVRRFDLLHWSIEGLLSAHAVDTAAPAPDGGPGKFGALMYIPVNLLVGNFRIVRATEGSGGSTVVEMYRLRSSAWTLLATLTVTGLTAMTVSDVSMTGSAAESSFVAGDIIMARLRSIETGTPAGLTVSAELR